MDPDAFRGHSQHVRSVSTSSVTADEHRQAEDRVFDPEEFQIFHRDGVDHATHNETLLQRLITWEQTLRRNYTTITTSMTETEEELLQILKEQKDIDVEFVALEKQRTGIKQQYQQARCEMELKSSQFRDRFRQSEERRLCCREKQIYLFERDREIAHLFEELSEDHQKEMDILEDGHLRIIQDGEEVRNALKCEHEKIQALKTARVAHEVRIKEHAEKNERVEAELKQRLEEYECRANAVRQAYDSNDEHRLKLQAMTCDHENEVVAYNQEADQRTRSLSEAEDAFQIEARKHSQRTTQLTKECEGLKTSAKIIEKDTADFEQHQTKIDTQLEGKERKMHKKQETLSRKFATLKEKEADYTQRNINMGGQLEQLSGEKEAFKRVCQKKLERLEQHRRAVAEMRAAFDQQLEAFKEKVTELNQKEMEFQQEMEDTNSRHEAWEIAIKEQDLRIEKLSASLLEARNGAHRREEALAQSYVAFDVRTATLEEERKAMEREEAEQNDLGRDVERRRQNLQRRGRAIRLRYEKIKTDTDELNRKTVTLEKKEQPFKELKQQLEYQTTLLDDYEEDIEARRGTFERRKHRSLEEAEASLNKKKDLLQHLEAEKTGLVIELEKFKRYSESKFDELDNCEALLTEREEKVSQAEKMIDHVQDMWKIFQRTVASTLNDTMEGRAGNNAPSTGHLAPFLHVKSPTTTPPLPEPSGEPGHAIINLDVPQTEVDRSHQSEDALPLVEAGRDPPLRRSSRFRKTLRPHQNPDEETVSTPRREDRFAVSVGAEAEPSKTDEPAEEIEETVHQPTKKRRSDTAGVKRGTGRRNNRLRRAADDIVGASQFGDETA